MPPAFNLSQDQTLQFDLDLLLIGIEVNFTSFRIERLIVPKNLGNPPSNAHAYRLYVVKVPGFKAQNRSFLLPLPNFAAISEALNYNRF